MFHVRRRETPHLFPAAHQRLNRTAAIAKTSRIQASIAALGDDDPEEVEVLKRALEKAQMQARTPPPETQIAQAIQFIERAKKRMAGVDEKIRQAAEALRQAEFEKAADIQAVAEAEAHVERLRAQSAQPPTTPSANLMQGVPVMKWRGCVHKLRNCKPKFRILPLRNAGPLGVVAQFPPCLTRSFLARCLHGWKSAMHQCWML